MRVLVTGSGGFVGTHLVDHLRTVGDDVQTWSGGDRSPQIQDLDAVRAALASIEVDAVYHLAAQSRVDLSWSDPADTMAVNAGGTANLIQALDDVGSNARVLVTSSAEVYGLVDAENLPVTEEQPVRPRSPYGISKAAAEQLALVSGEVSGRDVVVCRSFNQFGPGQAPTFVTSAFARQVVANERSGTGQIEVGNLSASRDFLDVRDAVRAFRAIVADGAPGQVYNVASGRETAVQDVLDALIAQSLVDQQVTVDPDRLRPSDLPRMVGSSQKLNAATGWRPEIDLETTLRDLLEFWRNEIPRSEKP